MMDYGFNINAIDVVWVFILFRWVFERDIISEMMGDMENMFGVLTEIYVMLVKMAYWVVINLEQFKYIRRDWKGLIVMNLDLNSI